MASGAPPIPIIWSAQTVLVGCVKLQVARLLLAARFALIGSSRISLPDLCWLDTGAPVSVIPFHIHQQRLLWHPLGVQTTWLGRVCDLGRIDVWFSLGPGLAVTGPFSLVAKFPQKDPPGDPVPVLLGLEFLVAHQAYLVLPPPPSTGTIQLS
jgi:hypothetical protein